MAECESVPHHWSIRTCSVDRDAVFGRRRRGDLIQVIVHWRVRQTMPPVRYAAAYGACGERRSKPNIKAVCSAQRVSELFVLQDLVWLVGRSESCSPGLRTGVGSQAATCPGLPASDRKRTRLNSSH